MERQAMTGQEILEKIDAEIEDFKIFNGYDPDFIILSQPVYDVFKTYCLTDLSIGFEPTEYKDLSICVNQNNHKQDFIEVV